MTPRIHISIPTYNRAKVALQCIPTVRAGMADGDLLHIYDDGSWEFTMEDWAKLRQHAHGASWTQAVGIDAQRRRHILDFWNDRERHQCTHLALVDSDCIADREWRATGLSLLAKYGCPVALYRTATHDGMTNNVFEVRDDAQFQRFAPGVFYLLTLEMVGEVIDRIPEQWSWDWHLPGLFNYRVCVPLISAADHVGHGGLHDKHERGYVSKERALSPTNFLMNKRMEILRELELKDT